MIYEIEEAVDDAILNLNDIAEEKDTPLFPASVKFIKETEKSENFLTANIMTVSVSASTVPENKLKKIHEFKSSNEPKVTVVKEDFVLHNVKQGKETMETIQSDLIIAIILNIESRFQNLKSCEEFETLILFDGALDMIQNLLYNWTMIVLMPSLSCLKNRWRFTNLMLRRLKRNGRK